MLNFDDVEIYDTWQAFKSLDDVASYLRRIGRTSTRETDNHGKIWTVFRIGVGKPDWKNELWLRHDHVGDRWLVRKSDGNWFQGLGAASLLDFEKERQLLDMGDPKNVKF